MSLTRGCRVEEAVEKERRGKRSYEIEVTKPAEQGDEREQYSPPLIHSSPLSPCSTYLPSWIKDDWLTTTNLFDPAGCEAAAAAEDVYNLEIKWGQGRRQYGELHEKVSPSCQSVASLTHTLTVALRAPCVAVKSQPCILNAPSQFVIFFPCAIKVQPELNPKTRAWRAILTQLMTLAAFLVCSDR